MTGPKTTCCDTAPLILKQNLLHLLVILHPVRFCRTCTEHLKAHVLLLSRHIPAPCDHSQPDARQLAELLEPCESIKVSEKRFNELRKVQEEEERRRRGRGGGEEEEGGGEGGQERGEREAI